MKFPYLDLCVFSNWQLPWGLYNLIESIGKTSVQNSNQLAVQRIFYNIHLFLIKAFGRNIDMFFLDKGLWPKY